MALLYPPTVSRSKVMPATAGIASKVIPAQAGIQGRKGSSLQSCHHGTPGLRPGDVDLLSKAG